MSSAPRKKGLLAAVAAVLIVIVIGGCLYSISLCSPIIEGKPTTPAQITEQLIEDFNFKEITEIKKDQLIKHYNIPEGLISDFSIYMSKSANQSFEIACFKLTEKENYEELKTVIAQHVDAKAQGFKELSPAEYEKIVAYQVVRKGDFVLMVISDDAQIVKKQFFSMM